MIEYMTKIEAIEEFNFLNSRDFQQNRYLSENYKLLREKLVKKFEDIQVELAQESSSSKQYLLDIKFGLYLYQQTNNIFNLRDNISIASNENFWIYINMIVIPDLVFLRWKSSSNLKARFFEHTKRIYTNSIWWYIHLTWQGTYNNTYEVIENLTTDVLLQLTERSGSGYNVELTRGIIKRFGGLDNMKNNDFRLIMKWHVLYVKTFQPEFYDGGINGYLDFIFSKVE